MDPTEDTLKRELRAGGWLALLRWQGFVWLVIPLLWAVTYLPQLDARDLRLEEGRRAQPAAEMLATGNWITPQIYGETYLNKPPLFFWIAAAFGKIQGGVNELSIRLPSVISVLLGAWLILCFAHDRLTRQTRALAALIFLSMPTMLDKGTLGEIDALLSLVTFACFAVLWHGYDEQTGTIAFRAWTVAGLLTAAGVLMKGPGGPIQFYAIFIPFCFLAGRGRWRILFSPGHFLMIAIAAVPMLLWMAAMIGQSNLGADTVSYQWADQLGLRKLLGTPAAFPGQKEPTPIVWEHYVFFPYQVLLEMLPPWSLLAILPTLPWFARRIGWTNGAAASQSETESAFQPGRQSRALWLLVAVSAPALLAVFWAYPAAFARHMMMVAYPVSILVAMYVATTAAIPPWEQLRKFLHSAAVILAVALIVIALGCVVAARQLPAKDLALTCVLAGIAVLIAGRIVKLTVKTPLPHAPIAAAASLAILMTVGRGLTASVFLPRKAPTDATRIVHNQIAAAIPANLPIYTTRTLLSGKGNAYFNIQFYFPSIPTGINDISEIPRNRRVILIIGWEEWPELMKVLPLPHKFTILRAENGPPHIYALEITLPQAPVTAPASTTKSQSATPALPASSP